MGPGSLALTGKKRLDIVSGVHEGTLPLTPPLAALEGLAFATPFASAPTFSEGTLDYLTEFPNGSAGVSAPLTLSVTITLVDMVGGFFGGHGRDSRIRERLSPGV